MIIKSVRVQNFRCILDETLECKELTALVGPNGAGKSSFLRALEIFYKVAPKFDSQDFYAEDTSQDIEIAVTFTELDKEETELFDRCLEEGDLTVVRVLSLTDGKSSAKYHGSTLQSPDFAEIRSAGTATAIRAKYNEVRQRKPYTELPAVRSKDEALEAMKQWELAKPDKCTRQRDDGQFFGFTAVAQGYLGRHTRFISIPAVRDAADEAADVKGSSTMQIMDLVVRSTLASRRDIKELKENTQTSYDEIMDPENLPELRNLKGTLTSTLQTYVPSASVELSWDKAREIDIPMPKANVELVEDGYRSAVIRTGHGLQRAFILTMLQHLAVAQASEDQTTEKAEAEQAMESEEPAARPRMPNLILGIEEPELYQHPNRQRRFAKVLLQLATGAIEGVAQKTQIIYATHSPLFVGLDRFDYVRLFGKIEGEEGKPRITKIFQTTLDQIAEILWRAKGQPEPKFTGATLGPRLRPIMTPWMSEGFFADVVVLVEGEDDRAAILGTAASMGNDLESHGVSVIPCMGKCNLDRPASIFGTLEIPTYLVWDSDEGKHDADPELNRYLLRLLGEPEIDWPSAVQDRFACFKKDLETTLREEIGADRFDELLQNAQSEFGISKKKQALKNPVVIQRVIEAAKEEGKSSETLESIVKRILAVKPPPQDA